MPRGEYDDAKYIEACHRMEQVVTYFLEEAGADLDDIPQELENVLENERVNAKYTA